MTSIWMREKRTRIAQPVFHSVVRRAAQRRDDAGPHAMAVACAGHLPFKIGGATSDPMCALHKLRWGSDPLFFAVCRQ